MTLKSKNFEHLLGLPGFSDTLLKNHFTLYQGYVTNTNKLRDILTTLLNENKQSTPEFAELTRRFGWEFNGIRLHEIYFGNLSKEPKKVSGFLLQAIEQQFGSYNNWEKEMRAICSLRGIGWAILYYDPSTKNLFNCWINEHDVGHLASCVPLIVIDIFEHAYITDYGIKRADYLDAIFKVLDFTAAQNYLTK